MTINITTTYYIPIVVGVGKERHIKNWSMVKPEKEISVPRTALRTTGPVPVISWP